MPLRWETNSTPLLGGRAQEVINEQIVEEADLLVGVFWTRLGTNTGKALSGTAEEIEQFYEANKPVMLYFSQSPIDPDKIDLEQFTALKKFKEKMRLRGLTESYSGEADFRQKFTRQLGINLNNLLDSIAADRKSQGKELPKSERNKQKKAVQEFVSITQDEAEDFLLRALESTQTENGWASLAAFGHYLKVYTPVDHREFGYLKLTKYLESTGLFQIRRKEGSNNLFEISKSDAN